MLFKKCMLNHKIHPRPRQICRRVMHSQDSFLYGRTTDNLYPSLSHYIVKSKLLKNFLQFLILG